MRAASERSDMSTRSGWHLGGVRIAVPVIAAVTVLAACGGSSAPAAGARRAPSQHAVSGSKVVLDSVAATAAAKTARMSLVVSASGLGKGFSASVSGVTDFTNGNSQFSLSLGGLLPGSIEERSVDKVVYVQLPASLQGALGLPAGGRWVSMDLSKVGSVSGSIPGLGQSDPKQFLAYLETVSNNVQDLGAAAIRGVGTTHYRATLDLGKSVNVATVPPQLRSALKRLLAKDGGNAPTIPADVWVDAEGRLRRLTLSIDLSAFAGAAGGSAAPSGSAAVTVSIDLYDFGVPVDVQAPPADQVTQLPGLGGLGGFGSGAYRASSPISSS